MSSEVDRHVPPEAPDDDGSISDTDACSLSSASTFVEVPTRCGSEIASESDGGFSDTTSDFGDEWDFVESHTPPLNEADAAAPASAEQQASGAAWHGGGGRNIPGLDYAAQLLQQPTQDAGDNVGSATAPSGGLEGRRLAADNAAPPTTGALTTTRSSGPKYFAPHGKGRATTDDLAESSASGAERVASASVSTVACADNPDEVIARALQEEEDAAFARSLQIEEDEGGADWDEADDGGDDDVASGPHGLTDDQLLSLLPLTAARRARIVSENALLGGSLAQPSPHDSSRKSRDDRHHWTAALHPSSIRKPAEFDYDEDYATTLPKPSTSRETKGVPRLPRGTPDTFECPLCSERFWNCDAVVVPCPERHRFCRGCLHGWVRNSLAREHTTFPLKCSSCRGFRDCESFS